MKKIKYQGGITKILCQKRAALNKKLFLKKLPGIDIKAMTNARKVEMEIYSLSGSTSFEDQLLSIISFLVHGGIPRKWTIYSDGSYSEEQKEIFRTTFPFVSTVYWDVYDLVRTNKLLGDYLKGHHLAKKLNIILGHVYNGQTMYLDSDIIFCRNFDNYLGSGLLNKGLWYAPDTMWGNVDNYFKKSVEQIYPLNSGMLLLNEQFNKNDVFEYLESLKGNYHYFSEQSSIEYAFRKQDANILDPRQFIVDSSDQFDFAAKHHPHDIAMRHYTGPVRHKIWQYGWKWHLTT